MGASLRRDLDDEPVAEEVAAWLKEHPDFLARRPELYRVLTPPKRIHGENLADHMAAMVAAERARMATIEAEVAEAIADGRAGAGLVLRVRLAVLALMRARDVPEAIQHELPPLLRVETCTLLAEPRPPRALLSGRQETAVPRHGVRAMPEGAARRLLGTGRDARVRADPEERELLHGEAAALVVRDALVRVPLWCGTPCLLALGAREASALPLRQTAQTLAFLGRAVAAALSR
ncbi:hypothetical protein [Falsiroseomonas sp. CW058]|uniref:hypothetical protein n=1 Tax=Falsiroseomonas sp. CW058 TaxID=3388664 RepID=UPI003D317A64